MALSIQWTVYSCWTKLGHWPCREIIILWIKIWLAIFMWSICGQCWKVPWLWNLQIILLSFCIDKDSMAVINLWEWLVAQMEEKWVLSNTVKVVFMTISNFAGELRRIVARTVQWQCKANVFDSDVWWHECGERVHRVHQAHGNVFILAQTMIFFFSFLFNAVIHIKNTLVNTITCWCPFSKHHYQDYFCSLT